MKHMLTMISGWALAVVFSYAALALVGFACKLMYLSFMSGWRWL